MKRLFKKLESVMAAVAFAEEGEVETAREIAADPGDEQRDDRSRGRTAAPPRGRARPLAKGSTA